DAAGDSAARGARRHAGRRRYRPVAAGSSRQSGMTTTDLDLRGMSCASCAGRIEGALNGLDGVRAAVNFALERAHVQHESAVSVDALIRAVESTGYQASPVVDPFGQSDEVPRDELRHR